MTILIKGIATKGTPFEMELDKAALALVAKVAADTNGFANSANWDYLAVSYVSTVGNQKKTVLFDTDEAQPIGFFKSSVGVLSSFQVKLVTLFDRDGGSLPLTRTDLGAATADFDFSFGLPPVLYATRLFTGSFTAPVEGDLHVGNSSVVDSKLYQFGPGIIGSNSYRMLYPKSSNITTQVKSSNLKVRVYVDSIEGSGSYGVYWTDQGTGSALTATTAEIAASVAANGYHEFDLTRIAYNVGGPDYFNLCHDFIGAAGTDKIRISKIELYQQGA